MNLRGLTVGLLWFELLAVPLAWAESAEEATALADAWTLHGRAWAELGQPLKAKSAFESALQWNGRSVEAMQALAESLCDLRRFSEAQQLWSSLWVLGVRDRATHLGLAKTFVALGAFSQALGFAEEGLRAFGTAADFEAVAVWALVRMGRVDEAAARAMQLAEASRFYFHWALLQLASAPSLDAEAFFEWLLARDARDRVLWQALLDSLLRSGALHRAQELVQRAALQGVKLSVPVTRKSEQNVQIADEVEILQDDYRIYPCDSEKLCRYWKFEVQIDGPAAWARYRRLTVDFWAQSPPRILNAVLTRPDQTEVRLETGHLRPDASGDLRTMVVEFGQADAPPPVGSRLLLETETPLPFVEGHQIWDGTNWLNEGPTRAAHFEMRLPFDWAFSVDAVGVQLEREQTDAVQIWRFSQRDLPPRALQREPVAVFWSSFASWADVDRWYGVLSETAQPSAQVAERARALCEGQSRRACVQAILRTVSQFDYVSHAFGRHAFRPNPPEVTLAQRKGDCKDLTALMRALLAARGIPSFAALVDASGRKWMLQSHPSPGWFDHVLLYVPDGAFWLDATDREATLLAPPRVLRRQKAFVIDRKGGFWAELPDSDPELHLFESEIEAHAVRGGYEIRLEAQLLGDVAAGLRLRLRGLQGEDVRRHLSQSGRILPLLAPNSLELRDFERSGMPMRLKARFRVTKAELERIDWSEALWSGLLRGDDGQLLPFGRLKARVALPQMLGRTLRDAHWQKNGAQGEHFVGDFKVSHGSQKTRIALDLRIDEQK